jgi:hypothetical protein
MGGVHSGLRDHDALTSGNCSAHLGAVRDKYLEQALTVGQRVRFWPVATHRHSLRPRGTCSVAACRPSSTAKAFALRSLQYTSTHLKPSWKGGKLPSHLQSNVRHG